MKKPTIVDPALDLPLPSKEQMAARVAQMKANGVREFIPLVQAIARLHGEEAYTIAQEVFASCGYPVTLAQLRDPNEKGVGSYPWR